MDEPVKWPGFTHGAFIVESLRPLLEWAAASRRGITEGPVDWGRRLTCFLRDPDGNVLEFNELLPPPDGRGVMTRPDCSSSATRTTPRGRCGRGCCCAGSGCDFEEVVIPLYREESRAAVLSLFADRPVARARSMATSGSGTASRYPASRPIARPRSGPATLRRERSSAAPVPRCIRAFRPSDRACRTMRRGARSPRAPHERRSDADIARIEQIWTEGRRSFGADGPWLAGEFGIGDIMFAPVASRFRTYE